MTTEFNDTVVQGYLRLKSKTVGVWQKKWIVLKKASSKGPLRLEKYADEKSSWLSYQSTTPVKYIDLSQSSDVYRLPDDIRKKTVAIINKDGTSKQLLCDSEMEATDWVNTLQEQCRLHNSTTVDPTQKIASDRFNVYLLPSNSLDIYGECVLHLGSTSLDLYDVLRPDHRLASWPYTSLRRYGGDPDKFTFVSGRHCDTGEGLFILNTSQGEKIYHKVQIASIAIAETCRMERRDGMKEDHKMVEKTQSTPLPEDNTPSVSRFNSGSLPMRAPMPVPVDPNRGAYEQPVPPRPQPSLPSDYTVHVPRDRPVPPPPRASPAYINNNNKEALGGDFLKFLSRREDEN